jgi:hypothetical protein
MEKGSRSGTGSWEGPIQASRKRLKVPTYTMAPSSGWTEGAGLRRAVAVLKTEAAILRREGYTTEPTALLRVAAALSKANRRGSTTGEATVLNWVLRDNATAATSAPVEGRA